MNLSELHNNTNMLVEKYGEAILDQGIKLLDSAFSVIEADNKLLVVVTHKKMVELFTLKLLNLTKEKHNEHV